MKKLLLLFGVVLLSTFITKVFAAGPPNHNLASGTYTSCSATIYDSGGTGDYANSQDITETYTPNAACNYTRVAFTSFTVETCCDNLKIYDGPNIASPLLGTYTASPGTITSTHPTGSLTFVWHSDGSIVAAGWVANLTCVAGTPCAGTPNAGTAVATPNTINCTVTSSVISATGLSTTCGISYQWQSAPAAAGPWTNIAGATNTTYTANPSSNTYYRIVSLCSNSGLSNTSSSVLLSSTFSPPANDECANAVALTVNANYSCGVVSAGTVACASPSSPATAPCFGTADDDVWYKFVATGTAHRISLTNVAGSTTDMYHAIYSGTCGTLTNIACNDADITNLTGLSIGATYYVRVYTYTATTGQTSTFNVCVGSPPPPPSNDAPCSSILATVNADLLCGSVTAGYTTSATNSGIAACVGSGADDDVWFRFVATSTVHNFDLLNIVGSTTDMVFEIFSGACGSINAGSSIACSDPQSNQFTGFTIGQTYYLRVYTYTATTGQSVDFNLCIGTPPPPPSNDEPCGAIPLSVNFGGCALQSAVLGTSSTLSVGMPAPGCSSLGPDVWFTAVVPASGRLIIDLAPSGGPTDFGMAWYSGPNCNNLNTLIECDDDQSVNGAMPMICRTGLICTVPGDCDQNATLTPGMTVYVRVWEYGGGTFGPFDICAYEPNPPGAPSNCASATIIPSLPYTDAGQTTCCRVNSYNSTTVCASSYENGEDYMYTYTPAANQTIDVTLTGTLSYTGIFITDKCPTAGGVNCVASATSVAGNPTLCAVNLTGGVTYYIMIDTQPTPTCTPFNIMVTSSSTPTCGLNYAMSSIGFAPDLNAGTNIALPIDDRFTSSYVPLGFNFCFNGYEFSQGLISSNGYVIFDPIGCASNLPGGTNAAPGAYSAWSINAAIPNTTNAPRNSIMFPWQDIDPSLGGTIRYQVLGVAPNRRFVVTFDQIPYFSCNSLLFTGQLKLFETTGNIEMHITNKEICGTWNGGDAILGLHSFNGTVAVTNAGHNYPTNWNETNTAYRFTNNCVGPCIVLPVELLSFDGMGYDNYNLLEWSTASEINNNHFIIERSNDGQNFEVVATVPGGGNSSSLLTYSYRHNNPKELEYYRLKQVDFDGKFEYSKIIAVRNKTNLNVTIYPNPSKNNLFIGLSENTEGTYTIVYTSILGSISKEQIQISEGTNVYQVNEFVKLSSGIYFVQIIDENNEVIKTQKIVKQ